MKQKLYRHLDIDIESVALVDLHDTIWSLLEEGVHNNSSAFHTPALATIGDNGADVRTVVLRHADPAARQICCHTDWRSPKRRQIENPSPRQLELLRARAQNSTTLTRHDVPSPKKRLSAASLGW